MRRIPRQITGSRRAQVVALLVVATFVAGLSLLGLWLAGGGSEPAQSEAEPPPLTADDFWPDKEGVLHTCSVPGEEADWPAGWCASEIWFDPRNQHGRADSHDRDGTLQYLAVADGDAYAEYRRDEWIMVRRRLNGGGWQQWLMTAGQAFQFQAWVRRGIIDATETSLDGVPALRIQVPEWDEDGKVQATQTIYLDRETELPIRVEREAVSEEGVTGEKQTYTSVHKVVEWLPLQDVDPALFTLPEDLPQVTRRERQTEMTVDEARAFSGFDVYWPGQTFGGQVLSQVVEVEVASKISGVTHYVGFYYEDPGKPDEPGLNVSNDAVETLSLPWDKPVGMPGSPGAEVTVAGTRAVLFVKTDGAQLRLQLGDTLITINGHDEEQVLAAGDALAKLN